MPTAAFVKISLVSKTKNPSTYSDQNSPTLKQKLWYVQSALFGHLLITDSLHASLVTGYAFDFSYVIIFVRYIMKFGLLGYVRYISLKMKFGK